MTVAQPDLNRLPLCKTERARYEFGYVWPIDGLRLPFGVIEASAPGPTLLVTAGIHGAEFCAIEAASSLLSNPPAIDRGMLLVLPLLNVEGFMARAPFVMPQYGRNLNHVFPGAADGTLSERLADWLVSEVYVKTDAYVDLHNGDIVEALVPFTIFPRDHAPSRELALEFGFDLALASPGRGFAIADA